MKVKKLLFGQLGPSTSVSGEVNSVDYLKTFRLLLVVLAGSAATAVLNSLATWIAGSDLTNLVTGGLCYVNFCFLAPLIMPSVMTGLSALIELGRRYIAQHFPPVDSQS